MSVEHTPADDRRSLVAGEPGGKETALLVAIFCVGIGLRAAWPERMAVEHFDEGVYAANWFCLPPGLPEGTYPRQYLYAPPLLPEVCFWTLFAAGGSPHAVMWINVIAGSLMIPLVWWMGRGWFGPAAGLTAAALCACSDVHVAFSRMVLTDVLLCLFLTAGVGAGVRAIQTGRPLMIALAGVLAGLAWWTKYNGWLTPAITGAGLAGWLVLGRSAGISRTTFILRWLATVVIAGIVWSPVLWNLQPVGGYAAVAENHARYFVGAGGWWESLRVQIANQRSLDSRLGIALAALAVAVMGTMARMSAASASTWANAAACGICQAAVVVMLSFTLESTTTAFAMIAIIGLVQVLWRDGRCARADADGDDPRQIVVWTVLAWLLGLLVSVPLYTPYPRLLLPLVCGSWFGMSTVVEPGRLRDRSPDTTRRMISVAVMCAAVATWLFLDRTHARPNRMMAWDDRRGLSTLAGPIAEAAAADFAAAPSPGVGAVRGAIYVFAEPALFYHLSAREIHPNGFHYLVQPIGDHGLLERGPPEPATATYVITGLHADAVAADRAAFDAAVAAGRLTLVREWEYEPSRLVALDHKNAAEVPARVRLFRVQTPAAGRARSAGG